MPSVFRVQSDLNLMGVCGGLLAEDGGFNSGIVPNGLLHAPPQEVHRKHPLFSRCAIVIIAFVPFASASGCSHDDLCNR